MRAAFHKNAQDKNEVPKDKYMKENEMKRASQMWS